MGNFEDNHFYREVDSLDNDYTPETYKSIPTESEYQAIGKAQAELFANELRDIYTRYQYSTVGDMERSGMLTAGEDILSALSKIELFKSAL